MRDVTKSKKGSMTVEMAFIFPIVLVFIIFICFIAAMLYNRTVGVALVNKNLDKATIYWSKTNIDFKTGAYTSGGNALYDFESNKKKATVGGYIKSDIGNCLLANGVKITPELDTSNYIIYRKLKAKVTIDYGVPFGGLFKIIGITKPIKDEVYVESVINNPVEFTRNIDVMVDVWEDVKFRNDIKLGDNFTAFTNKMNKLLNDFEQFVK
ncbi:TadE-like protein [Clostridium cavendishii DSM 21758]|uniref:TadE-like protein n=1 Tax=Clostridium cavendishii DSM 21758 TaxID=1121302 RepID=A0A1M6QHA0_9CLOT|nr:TadE family protein [Clostridium cavendishii]SHK19558.1 TadE-like protein [Clostridium cavendishii DSM 21758]